MKKATMILAVAFVAGLLSVSTLKAMQPMQFSGMMININMEIELEQDIKLEKWMYSPDSFQDQSIEERIDLQSWMIETGSWNTEELSAEGEIELEDWMINRVSRENNTIALEEWMTKISG